MVLDPAILRELRALENESDPGLVTDLARMFAVQVPHLVQVIRDACVRGDAHALEEGAHLLKSTAANLGATELSDLARKLERYGREKQMPSAEQTELEIRALEAEAQTACQAVAQLLAASV